MCPLYLQSALPIGARTSSLTKESYRKSNYKILTCSLPCQVIRNYRQGIKQAILLQACWYGKTWEATKCVPPGDENLVWPLPHGRSILTQLLLCRPALAPYLQVYYVEQFFALSGTSRDLCWILFQSGHYNPTSKRLLGFHPTVLQGHCHPGPAYFKTRLHLWLHRVDLPVYQMS